MGGRESKERVRVVVGGEGWGGWEQEKEKVYGNWGIRSGGISGRGVGSVGGSLGPGGGVGWARSGRDGRGGGGKEVAEPSWQIGARGGKGEGGRGAGEREDRGGAGGWGSTKVMVRGARKNHSFSSKKTQEQTAPSQVPILTYNKKVAD